MARLCQAMKRSNPLRSHAASAAELPADPGRESSASSKTFRLNAKKICAYRRKPGRLDKAIRRNPPRSGARLVARPFRAGSLPGTVPPRRVATIDPGAGDPGGPAFNRRYAAGVPPLALPSLERLGYKSTAATRRGASPALRNRVCQSLKPIAQVPGIGPPFSRTAFWQSV